MTHKIGLVQVNNSFSGAEYLPYTVGVLQAYAQRHLEDPEDFEFLPPVYKRIPLEEAVKQLHGARAVFFSLYVWNEQYSLELARRLVALDEDLLCFFGGPQVPDDPYEWLKSNDGWVAGVVHGEGEVPFLNLLNLVRGQTPPWEIPSFSWGSAHKGVFGVSRTDPVKRMSDLNQVSSPYTSGVFAPLMATHPDENWIAIWETNRGCPYSCAFCDWGSAVGAKVTRFPMEQLKADMGWFSDHQIQYVFCADANYGILPRDVAISQYMADVKRANGYPQRFSVQNAKNATDRTYEAQKILNDAGMNQGVTLGIQTLAPSSLRDVQRENISLDTYRELQRRFRADGIPTYTDLILGLPGETYDSWADGICALIEQGQHDRVQVNNLSILPNSDMGDVAYQQKHGLQMIETDLINVHGRRAGVDEWPRERQVLVVGTNTMPPQDWVRARMLAWMVSLLHFDKLLQIPLVVLHYHLGVSYQRMVEAFLDAHLDSLLGHQAELTAMIWAAMEFRANHISQGGPEYSYRKEWLDIWWPVDEFCLIWLARSGRFEEWYDEAVDTLAQFCQGPDDADILDYACRLNRDLVKRPFQPARSEVAMSWRVWEYYQAACRGEPLPEIRGDARYVINRGPDPWRSWEEWMEKCIWWGNKRGDYLWECTPINE